VARVLVSHASQDHPIAVKLHEWLVEDGHEAFLDQDLRDGIGLGDEWEPRLHERLRWADAVVCLVTASYRKSLWCAAEVGIARSKGSRLLPLSAEPGDPYPLLTPSRYQYADLVRDPIAARAKLREALYRLDVGGGSGWQDDLSPFPGLRAFDTGMQRVFFGRETEINQLAARLRSPSDSPRGQMLLVVGPSGCGKSSLVRAGLVPVMAREPGWHALPPMVPGNHPVAALAAALTRGAEGLPELGWTVSSVREDLKEDDGLAVLSGDLLLKAASPQRRVLLVLDQFEELVTMATAEARDHFARLLRPAIAGSVQVVGTLRPEFLGQLLASPELRDLAADTFALRPLRHDALHRVIEEPAEVAGITVDDQLVESLVEDTETGEALPLLAFTLAQLAEDVPRGGRLSTSHYKQLGGVQGALRTQADAALDDAVAATHRTPDQVISGLLRLVTVDEHGHPTRSLVDRAELAAPVQAELEAFTAKRLVTADLQEDGRVVLGVTHEAFLSAWPPLAAAITAHEAALKAQRAVESAAAEWDGRGRSSLLLWERGQLAATLEATGARSAANPSNQAPTEPRTSWLRPIRFRPGHRVLLTDKVELSTRARDFLQHSIRRDRSRRRRATTVLSVLLSLALVAAAVALVQQRVAQAQRQAAEQQLRIATARQLITEADASLDDDPFEALQLGIAAQDIEDNAETRANLVTSLISTPYAATLTGHDDLVAGLTFSPNGKILASCSDDDTCRLWDFTNVDRPTPLGEPIRERADVNSVAFTPDGRILALGMANKTIHLWSLDQPAHPAPLGHPVKAHNGEVRGVGFADMSTLVSAGEDGLVRVWDITDPNHPSPAGPARAGHRGAAVRALAINRNRRIAATGDVDAYVRLWSLDRNQLTPLGPPLKGHSRGMLRSLAFSPDGLRMVTVSDDRTARVWNVADPHRAAPIGPPLTGHQDEVTSVAISPNELVFATGSDDQTVREWNLEPTHLTARGRPLTGAHDEVYSVAFTPDGSLLAAGIGDGVVVVWSVAGGTLPAPLGAPLVGHKAGVDPVAFSATGDLLASASEDMTVKLWQLSPDPAHPSLVSSLRHEDEVASAAFSPDRPVLATGSEGTVHLWNVANPRHPVPLGETLVAGDRAVVSLAFCQGKDILASGDEGGKVRLWQLTNPEHPAALGSPLEGNDDEVDSVACSPDGAVLAAAGTGMVRLWGLAARTPVPFGSLVAGHGQAVNSVAFSPDGYTLAAAADDGLVTLWDIRDPRNATPLGAPLRAHGDPVTSVAFSPKNPRTMATASDDKTVRLWDLTVRELPVPLGPALAGHQEAVNSVAIGASGMMASASDDKTLRLWDLSKLDSIRQDPIAYACSRTGRGFNPDEWKRQISALPYQKTCPG
jgi:WD40 repeat protein/energy-coupling factor transporter ATP-binding protein EcfA2